MINNFENSPSFITNPKVVKTNRIYFYILNGSHGTAKYNIITGTSIDETSCIYMPEK